MEDSSSKITSIRHINNNQTQLLCLTGDAQILMGDGSSYKMIKDIEDNEQVMTVNPQTLVLEPSYMWNKFNKMSEKLSQSGVKINSPSSSNFSESITNNEENTTCKTDLDCTEGDNGNCEDGLCFYDTTPLSIKQQKMLKAAESRINNQKQNAGKIRKNNKTQNKKYKKKRKTIKKYKRKSNKTMKKK
jgi:hypothetical protein